MMGIIVVCEDMEHGTPAIMNVKTGLTLLAQRIQYFTVSNNIIIIITIIVMHLLYFYYFAC